MAYRLSQVDAFSVDASFNQQPLFGQKLGDVLPLSSLGLIVFHWADFSETCEVLESQMKADETLSHDFIVLKERVQSLRSIPLWIKTKNKIRQFNLFELYSSYILNQTTDRLDPHTPMDISFISGSGPFKNLAISECFNHQLYRDMVMVLLIEKKLPKRDFRIRVKAKILAEYGSQYESGHLFQMEQMTQNGLLFSCDSEFYFKEWPKMKNIRLLLNSQMMAEASKMSLEEMKLYFDQFPFNLMYSSRKDDAIETQSEQWSVSSGFDFFKDQKVYLFLPFNSIEKDHHEAVTHLKSFVSSTKELVRKIAQEI
ncbi:MAG: hypothetical protein ACOVP4_07665 [Bacteriovoracaceae bacterium]